MSKSHQEYIAEENRYAVLNPAYNYKEELNKLQVRLSMLIESEVYEEAALCSLAMLTCISICGGDMTTTMEFKRTNKYLDSLVK